MAKPIHQTLQLRLFMLFLLFYCTCQQSPESQALWKIKKLLSTFNLNINATNTLDFCTTTTSTILPPDPNPSLILACYENNNITQLHITGNYNNFNGYMPIPTDSFFSSLATILPNVKVLCLTSLGLQGPLPGGIISTSLSSLEILNISSNQFIGEIPIQISSLRNLQTLILDHNRFTGQVPSWLPQLPLLTVISFKNNSLVGSLPDSLSQIQSLRVLILSVNRLSGQVPYGLVNLTNLQVLDLESNLLGPHFPSLHNRCITIVLRENRFRFGIPSDQLKSFYQLQKLDVSLNKFNGPFSSLILSLPSLTYLDISDNKFTGMLSENVSCSDELGFVNLSSNRLTGELPCCLHRLEKRKDVLYGGNCLSKSDGQHDPNDSLCHNQALAVKIVPRNRKELHSRSNYHPAIIASSVVGGIALLSALFLVITRRDFVINAVCKTPRTRLILDKVEPAYTVKMLTDARYIYETIKLAPLGIPTYRTFVLEEIKEATNNFHTSSLLGNGSRGQLYKGQLTDGTMVVIRNMKMRKRCRVLTYTRQIELISKLRHAHLASAIGHCFECYPDDSSVSSIFLVFEFVPNGTLRSFLTAGQKFTWTQRIAAAIGVAKGIQFLHTGIVPAVFPNHLKITDVLLDHNFHVKISHCNLPLLAETRSRVGAGVSVDESKGSLQRRFNYEDNHDVYDLGVILLEIIVGREINSENDTTVAKDLLQVSLAADGLARKSIIDPAIHKECSDESLKTLMELCVRCLSIDHRFPSIDDVLWNLQFVAQVQDPVIGSPVAIL